MTFLQLIESFLGPLNNEFGKLMLSVAIIAFFALSLNFIGVSKILLFLCVLVSILMFAAFTWIPLWIVIGIGIGLFGIGFVNVRSSQ